MTSNSPPAGVCPINHGKFRKSRYAIDEFVEQLETLLAHASQNTSNHQ